MFWVTCQKSYVYMYYLFSIPILLYPVLKKGRFSCPRQVQGTSMDKIFFISSCLWGDQKTCFSYPKNILVVQPVA